MKPSACKAIVLAFLLFAFSFAWASDWPQWRGPLGMGISLDRDLPLTWDGKTNENVLWKAPLPKCSESQSSPIVCKDRVFVMTAFAKPLEQHVTCYQKKDGTQLWDTIVPPGPWILTDLRGGYCCSTPATDGERVIVVFGSATMAALDYTGKIVWQKDILPRAFDVAISSSPILYRDSFILLCDQTGGKSFLAAYDPKTGAEKWVAKRPQMSFNHSTPLLALVNAKPQLIISAHEALQGVNPDNGEVVWWCAHKGDVPSPAIANGLVYCDEGRGNVGICVDASGTGDVTKTHLKWKTAGGINGFGSPLIVGEHIYRVSSTLRCWELATGKELWSQRLGGDFNPSPFATPDGRIYFAGAGASWVIRAGPKFELLGKSDLGEPSSASAGVSDGCLFLKGQKNLFCVGTKR